MKYRLLIFFSALVALTSCNRLGHGRKSQPTTDTQPAVTRNDAITVAQAKEEYQYMQGCIEYSIGNYEESRIAFLEVIKLDDQSAATYYMLADIYRRQGDLATAITYAESAVRSGGNNEWYNVRLGELYLLRGRNDEAIAQYEHACFLDPDNTDMLLKLAQAQITTGKYSDALITCNKIESKEGLSDTLCNIRLNVYSQTGNTAMQSQTYHSLIDAFPYEKENYYHYAGFFHASNMNDSAMNIYSAITKKFPHDAAAWVGIADIQQLKNHADALSTAKIAFGYPGSVEEKIVLMRSWYPVSDSSPALSSKQQIEVDSLCSMLKRTDPGNALTYTLSGDYLYHQKKFREARTMYAKAVSLDGNSFDTWTSILKINDALSDDVQQEKDCKSLIDLYPAQPEGYYYLGLLQLKKNDFAHAVATLQGAKDFSESKPSISTLVNVPLANAYRGKGDDAKADAFSASVIARDSTDKEMLLNYAASLCKRQVSIDDAQKLLIKYISIDAYNPTALELMGDLSSRKGNKNDAVMYWKKAKAAGSTSSSLDKKIATGSLE